MRIVNARLSGRTDLFRIEIEQGRFTAVTPIAAPVPAGTGDLDADGRLVTPQFVDAHLHLDYANTVGRPRENESGTLFEGIQIWAEHKQAGLVRDELVYQRALTAVRSEVAHGVGHIRTHVDITEPQLIALTALLRLKEDVADWCDVEIIAFPQNSVYGFPDGPALLERAVAAGADVVGGIPHLEMTRELGVRQLELVFDLAEKYDRTIDVHCDETDDSGSRFLEVMTAQTAARGMQGRVTASHAVAMAYYGDSYRARLLQQLLDVRMNFAINPTENLHLQGRGGQVPTPRGIAPVGQLLDWGLNVAFGQDSIADPWYPIGEGDLLRVLETGLQACHLLRPKYLRRCLDLITTNGATNMALDDYGIEVGRTANCLILDADSDLTAVRHQAEVLCSIHRGNVVFRKEPREYAEALPHFLG